MNLSPFTIGLIGVVGLLGVGFYGLLVSRNLIKIVVCLQILAKAALLALVAAGQVSGERCLLAQNRPEYGRLFLGANGAVVPKPTAEANRCNPGHVTPKTLQTALYVGSSEKRPPTGSVLRWSRFPGPGSAPRGYPRLANLWLSLSTGRSKPLQVRNRGCRSLLLRNMTFSRTPSSTWLSTSRRQEALAKTKPLLKLGANLACGGMIRTS